MANQIEVRTSSSSLAFPYRQRRSLMGNATTALLQPVTFYRTFPAARHWLWAALFTLVMVGWSAVRQEALLNEAESPGFEAPVEVPPMDPGMGGPMVPGGIPGGMPTGAPPVVTTVGQEANISETLMTALVAAGGVVVAWAIQALLLLLVSMLRGFAPSFGRNVQIAVWASLPLGLMSLFQLIYFAAGGQGGRMGLSLLLDQWPGYAALPPFTQAALISLLTQFTLFWLWSLILLYMGARHALDGSPTAAMLVVVFWLLIAVFVPVLTGAVTPPEAAAAEPIVPDLMNPSMEGASGDVGDEVIFPEGTEIAFPSEGAAPEAPVEEVIPNVRPDGSGGG
jgi:hypothetical protein